MAIPRVHLANIEFQPSQVLSIEKETRHYLINVLRLSPGDSLIVFNGSEEKEALATLTEASRKHAAICINEIINTDRESPTQISLVQGVGKSDHMDFAIQKSVELGVTTITLVNTERSQGRLSGERLAKKMKHWRGIIASACEQSGRCMTPSLSEPIGFNDYISALDSSKPHLIFSPNAEKSLVKTLNPSLDSVHLLIGPEGGFTEGEVESAIQKGAHAALLGPRVLRMETASIAAITCIQQIMGDFK